MVAIATLWWLWLTIFLVCGLLFLGFIVLAFYGFSDAKEVLGMVGCGGIVLFLSFTVVSVFLLVFSIILNLIDYVKA